MGEGEKVLVCKGGLVGDGIVGVGLEEKD